MPEIRQAYTEHTQVDTPTNVSVLENKPTNASVL